MQRLQWGLGVGVAVVLAGATAWGQANTAGGDGRTRLTLNLRDVEIQDALKLIAQQTGLNVVAGKEVTGKVTLTVKDVDVWQALDLLAFTNDIAYEQQERTVRVMTAAAYEQLYGDRFLDHRRWRVFGLRYARATQMIGLFEQLKSPLGRVATHEPSNTVLVLDVPSHLAQMERAMRETDRPIQTRLFVLSHAQPATAREQLASLLTPGVGVVTVDERTNQLAVTDVPEKLDVIERLLRAFDEPSREVLIEAKIIQVTLRDELSLGIDWQGVFRQAQARARSRFTALGDVLGGQATGGVFTFARSLEGADNVSVLVDAIKQVGQTEILSSPRIAAMDRQEAKILVGTKEAFVTTTTINPGGGSPVTAAEQVTFVDVGVKLYVTPTIHGDGWVSLKIRPEVSSVERQLETAQKNKIPIVRTSEAETQVLVQDGVTIIIAGLIEDRHERSRQQVPGLGDIPLVGAAFSGRTRSHKKTETVIFLTPHVLAGGAPLSAAETDEERTRRKAMDEHVHAYVIERAVCAAQRRLLHGEKAVEKTIP